MTDTYPRSAATARVARKIGADIREKLAPAEGSLAPWETAAPMREIGAAMQMLAAFDELLAAIDPESDDAKDICALADSLTREVDAAWSRIRRAALDE